MSIAALIVSIVSVIVAILALYKNWIDARAGTRENDFRARRQYNAEIRSWAGACTDALSDAVYLAEYSPADRKRLHDTISALSALVEQGRLFFPNRFIRARANSAVPAREGWRPRILDWLIFSLRICENMVPECDPEAEVVLKRMQAGFTSDVQLLLDPLKLYCTMKELEDLLSSGDFMDSSQTHPDIVAAKEFVRERRESAAGNPG